MATVRHGGTPAPYTKYKKRPYNYAPLMARIAQGDTPLGRWVRARNKAAQEAHKARKRGAR